MMEINYYKKINYDNLNYKFLSKSADVKYENFRAIMREKMAIIKK